MSYCKECGKAIAKSYSGMCQGCYNYFRKGGTIHPLPPKGRVEHDIQGKVICHICGRSYTRLGSHIRESHNMTISEYKEQFGLCSNARTTESGYSHHMRELSYVYEMPERLKIAGQATRIKKGDKKMRFGKPTRLQETLDKRERKKSCG